MLGVLADNVGAVLQVLTLLVSLLAVWTATRALAGNVRPQVECYIRVRPGSHVFYLALSNFGRGSAKNVAIELIGVDEQDFAEHDVIPKWRKKGTFVLLEPQGTVSTMFGFAPSLVGNDAAPLKPFAAVVKYEWKPFWTWRKRAEQRDLRYGCTGVRGVGPRTFRRRSRESAQEGTSKVNRSSRRTSVSYNARRHHRDDSRWR